MHATLRVFVLLIIGCFGSAARSELVFEQTQIELKAAMGDETAVGHFKYRNKGDKPVAIKSVTTSCGCTAASAKQNAAPGEEGEVTATFKIGDRVGLQQKAITVVTDDPAKPTTTLNLKVEIPQVLELQPTFVFWQTGETSKAKTILAKAGPGLTIKSLEASSSNPNFVAKVEPGPSANQFRINVEPKQLAQPMSATLTIKPALEKGTKVFYVTASVIAPASAAARQPIAPANPPAGKSKIDACALLSKSEIQSLQGEALQGSKPSGRTANGLAFSQCYFALATPSNSINLTVTQKGDEPGARDPKEQWRETFHHEKSEDKESQESEKKSEPEQIAGLGDEAFWVGSGAGGELYVLKGNSYLRISVGGGLDPAASLKKSKDVAQMVLKRL